MTMTKVLVIDERKSVAELIKKQLCAVESCRIVSAMENFASEFDTVVYSPSQVATHLSSPDLEEAKKVFERGVQDDLKQFVLISSAAAYTPQHNNTGLMSEAKPIAHSDKNSIANAWQDLETLAVSSFKDTNTKLAILRSAAVLVADGKDYFSRLLEQKFAIVLPGHDPSFQLLAPEDLAQAVCLAVEKEAEGVFNVAPDGVITLHATLRKAKVQRLPISRVVQRAARKIFQAFKRTEPIEQLDFIRYSWTVSNEKSKHELGFAPCYSSLETLQRFKGEKEISAEEFDEFGMDKNYIKFLGRTWFRFMHDVYWRVEVSGLELIPRTGRGVFVGVHRGFMPWDAVMFLYECVTRLNRYPRFLIHPGLIKYPFLFNFHTKLGGVVACQENADYILQRDELLGVFPEGIRGAFSLYKDAYKLGKFGRDDFVKIALRNRAPIIPYVTAGSAEIFPIIGRVDWHWWKKHTEWPFFPITPTWPHFPIPLPSKWHTLVLEPLHTEEIYKPEDANNPRIVRDISREVRSQMETALQELRSQRKSIFYGSIFKGEDRRGYQEKFRYKEKRA
jgi:1-acyl-sn-glycerol-3-phosphate acyltransferase/nucleoside-diphosphate-sugar epimerase